MDSLETADALDARIELLRLVSIYFFFPLFQSLRDKTDPFRLYFKANKTVTDLAPWKASSVPSDVYLFRQSSLEVLHIAGICLQPFIPEVAGWRRGLKGRGSTEWCQVI